jgi:hypothetical protein
MTGSALWLITLGSLGIAHPFVMRGSSKAGRWVLTGLQGLCGLNAALWGLWALIDAIAKLEFARSFPMVWTASLVGGFVQLVLAALFGATMLVPLLGKGDDAQKAKATRRLSITQAIAGVLAVGVGVASAVIFLGIAAP